MYKKSEQKLASQPVWANIKRNPFRARRKAVNAEKRRFYAIDFPELLRECEILTANREKHYCFHFKEWTKNPVGGIQKMNTGYLDKIFDTPIGKMTESNWNIIVWMFGYLEDHHWRDAFTVGNLDEESNLEDLQALVKGVYEHYSMDIDERLQKLLDLESWEDSY